MSLPEMHVLRTALCATVTIALTAPIPGMPCMPGPPAAEAQVDTLQASLLKRLAEAADALRDGETHWFLVDPQFPHRIHGVYPTQTAAVQDTTAPAGFRAFGPFRTEIDLNMRDGIVMRCVHTTRPDPSEFKPRSAYCPDRVFPIRDIASMQLILETVTGDTVVMDLDPTRVDAVFFNLSAFDKFVAPYYAGRYGAHYASDLREQVERLLRPLSLER